jgi:hypothetical protein
MITVTEARRVKREFDLLDIPILVVEYIKNSYPISLAMMSVDAYYIQAELVFP